MTMRKGIALALSSAALILSVGCSDSSSSEETTVVGTAIDGYLSGATACIDNNENGIAERGTDIECITTNEAGEYKLTQSLVNQYPVAITGGTDVLTGEAYIGSMSAPAGATVVTPLTTLVQATVKAAKDNGAEISAAQAESTVKKALGIPDKVVLTTFDPIDEANNGNDNAKSVLAVQTKVQVIQQTIAAAVASASGKDVKSATTSVATQMAAVIIATTSEDENATVTFGATDLATVVEASVNSVMSGSSTTEIANANNKVTSSKVAEKVAKQAEDVEKVINASDVKTSMTIAAKTVKVSNSEVKKVATAAKTGKVFEAQEVTTETLKTVTVKKYVPKSEITVTEQPAVTGAAN